MRKKKLPTLESLIADLETAKQIAIDDRHVTGLISATMAQAKLLGFDKGDVIEVNHSIKPTTIELIPMLTPEIARAISKDLEQEY